MLYDYAELAINKQVKELRLGRTAEEIKKLFRGRTNGNETVCKA